MLNIPRNMTKVKGSFFLMLVRVGAKIGYSWQLSPGPCASGLFKYCRQHCALVGGGRDGSPSIIWFALWLCLGLFSVIGKNSNFAFDQAKRRQGVGKVIHNWS